MMPVIKAGVLRREEPFGIITNSTPVSAMVAKERHQGDEIGAAAHIEAALIACSSPANMRSIAV